MTTEYALQGAPLPALADQWVGRLCASHPTFSTREDAERAQSYHPDVPLLVRVDGGEWEYDDGPDLLDLLGDAS